VKTAAGIIVLVLVCSRAWAGESLWVLDSKSSEAAFAFSSTLHDVKGSVGEYEGYLDFEQTLRSAAGQGIFSVSSMTTGNAMRDRKMKNMFESERFPKITYRFDTASLPESGQGQTELRGRLMIRDVTRVLPISVDVIRENHAISFTGETDIRLNDFNLKAPSVLGLIKVDDRVHVKFKIVYQEK